METVAQAVVWVGIDVSKSWLDVAVPNSGGGAPKVSRVEQSGEALDELVASLVRLGRVQVVLEASGGYERALVRRLRIAGVALTLVNPARARQFARSQGVKGKTDALDAAMLGRMGSVQSLQPNHIPKQDHEVLAALVLRREQAVGMRIAEERRREPGPLPKLVREQIDESVKMFERMIDDLEAAIDALIDSDPIWSAVSKACQTVVGVGAQTARVLLASMPELGTMNRRQAASLAGLAPHPRESGRWHGKRSISGGRPAVRRALFMAAMSAARCDPDMKAFHARVLGDGDIKKKARIAVARKLIVRLNGIVRDTLKELAEQKMA